MFDVYRQRSEYRESREKISGNESLGLLVLAVMRCLLKSADGIYHTRMTFLTTTASLSYTLCKGI